ncbi:family 4B encapsulin nanocompartment shell protein [Pyrococcus yayanosii]|nr:family 4B encapsulin nanocompartment shell protein [Pyrococcus yayanosii]
MGKKEEFLDQLIELINTAIRELEEEGLSPDILLAGSEFLKYSLDIIEGLSLSVYEIKELGNDAIIADSKYIGQLKKASRRISIEPLLQEEEWEEILKNLPEIED